MDLLERTNDENYARLLVARMNNANDELYAKVLHCIAYILLVRNVKQTRI